ASSHSGSLLRKSRQSASFTAVCTPIVLHFPAFPGCLPKIPVFLSQNARRRGSPAEIHCPVPDLLKTFLNSVALSAD
ncbi:MAG: hypothetical protein IKE30_11150, partial [Clostridia bacterium]|nr:hypothetical protein [Clostridia bacterium]